jgi:integrase
LAVRKDAKGGTTTTDIESVRGRVKVFIAIIGDRPLDKYHHSDFQTFINALQFWPPKPDDHAELHGKSIKEIIAINEKEEHRFGILGRSTAVEHYLSEMKTILDNGVIDAKIEHPIPKFNLIIPTIFKESVKRSAPAITKIGDALKMAARNAKLFQASLLVLGMFTGRRLGLLVYLRGSHFKRIDGYTIVQVPQHVVDRETGRVISVPIKTRESLTGFILNDVLDECGFSDFAISLGDQWIFPQWHQCAGPVDAAQKAINALLRDTEAGGTFHGLRHWYITALRKAGVSEYANRVQVGHALRDEHENYGELPFGPEDAEKVKWFKPREAIDISALRGVDFAELRSRTITR